MGTLRDKSTGQIYEVPDVDAVRAAQEDPSLEVTSDVQVSPQVTVTGQQATSRPGLRPISAEEQSAHWHGVHEQEAHDTFGSRAKAFLGGAIHGSTFLLDPWAEDQSYHPGYTLGGELLPALATIPFGGEGAAELGAEEAAGLSAEGAAAGAVEGGALSRASQAIRSYTPLGASVRAGEALGRLVPGAGIASRAARIGLEGATMGALQGGGMGLGKYLNDPDSDFNSEVLGGAANGGLWGGALGLGIGAVGGALERLGGLGRAAEPGGLSADEYAARMEPLEPGAPQYPNDTAPLHERLGNLSRTPGDSSLMDAVGDRLSRVRSAKGIVDDMIESPVLAQKAGWQTKDLKALYGSLGAEENMLSSLGKYPDAELPNLRQQMHTNDIAMARMSETTDRVPRSWADPAQRLAEARATEAVSQDVARQRAAGIEVLQAEEDARAIGAKLGLGRPDAAAVSDGMLARAARWAGSRVIRNVPGGQYFGKLASLKGLGAAGVGGLAVDYALKHGVSAMLGHGALVAGGAAVGARVLRALARNPDVGGLIASQAARVLNSHALLPGQGPASHQDPRDALRGLSNRARNISPSVMGGHVARTLSHVAGSSPVTVAKASQVAANRHAQLLQLLDREDPAAVSPGAQLMGRPLPSAAAAARVADFIRATSHPAAPLLMALDGRLTPAAMGHAERAFPNSIGRMRSHLMEALADVGPHGASPAQRRTVETLLGPQMLGGPSHGDFYRQKMASLASSASQPRAPAGRPPPLQPPGPIGTNPMATPAQRAANPAQGR